MFVCELKEYENTLKIHLLYCTDFLFYFILFIYIIRFVK